MVFFMDHPGTIPVEFGQIELAVQEKKSFAVFLI